MFTPRQLAKLGLILYFIAFAVLFVPFAFVSEADEMAKLIRDNGNSALNIAGLIALGAVAINFTGLLLTLKMVIGRQSPTLLGALGNLLPLLLVLVVLIRYNVIML
ncbi:hypothetical protein [Ferrimonas senticii]|uniref:hypothetical protein n=1 Tax=Ferrimonas senticii TaxID=394566 RepID=UPI00041B59B2|nr:hypothetical protein [Ferrimonas senticii]